MSTSWSAAPNALWYIAALAELRSAALVLLGAVARDCIVRYLDLRGSCLELGAAGDEDRDKREFALELVVLGVVVIDIEGKVQWLRGGGWYGARWGWGGGLGRGEGGVRGFWGLGAVGGDRTLLEEKSS